MFLSTIRLTSNPTYLQSGPDNDMMMMCRNQKFYFTFLPSSLSKEMNSNRNRAEKCI